MHPFELLILFSCIACAVLGTFVLTRDARENTNRLAAAIIFGGAWWAFCEILWTRTEDPDEALFLVRLSALGWVWVGPVGLRLLMDLVGDTNRYRRGLVTGLYFVSGLFLLMTWTTSWVHAEVVKTSWGWSFQLGPVYPLFYLSTVAAIFVGIGLAYRAYVSWPSEGERKQARGILVGIVVPMVVASVTDGIFPYFGIHEFWHLGSFSIAILGATVAFTFYRYGYSLLAPGTFAHEILETMKDGLALLHLDGRIRRANPALIQMASAADMAQILGLQIEQLIEGFGPDQFDETRDAEYDFTPFVGPPFPVSVALATLNDREGSPTGVVVVARDLREVVDLRQRLVISGRMVAVGQLAAGVAHELNNPMAYVRANLSLLQGHFGKLEQGGPVDGPEPVREELLGECSELLEESIEGIDRATSIIREIRNFSHAGTAEREETDVVALLDATERMVEPQIRHRARIERHDAPVPLVRCAPREIQQVLVNLLLNAADVRDAADPDRRIRIRLETASTENHVMVVVSDDGPGIPPSAMQRIFDPFYTTKPAGKGTGLGLSISYEIVRRHEGELRVESTPGEGARFTLMLPLDEGATA